MLKAIHAQEDKAAARQKAALVDEKLRAMKLERIASFVETSVEETLSYMDFPYERRSRWRTNNGLESIMKEIRRRTRVVGSFPDGLGSDADRSQAQTYFHDKMGDTSVYEHLQTLRRRYKVKGGRLRLRNRPAPPELSGRLRRLCQLTFVICNRSETNVRKISYTTNFSL